MVCGPSGTGKTFLLEALGQQAVEVDTYLLTRKVPAKGTLCVGDSQPFTEPLDSSGERSLAPNSSNLPPVVPPVPGATPRT